MGNGHDQFVKSTFFYYQVYPQLSFLAFRLPQYELRPCKTKMSVADEKERLETDTEFAPGKERQISSKAEAQPTLVSPSGDTENKNEETNESDDEDSSIAGTPILKSYSLIIYNNSVKT